MKSKTKVFVFAAAVFLAPALVFAQTVSLSPSSKTLLQNHRFDLNLDVSSVENLAGLSFDLQYDPSLIAFVEATDGGFFSGSGGQVSMNAAGTGGGNLSFSLKRLSGAVSGNGTAVKLSFRTLSKQGETTTVFLNNRFCLSGASVCDVSGGSWQGATLKVLNTPNDSSAPSAPSALSLVAASSTAVNLSWSPSTDNIEVTGYRIFRDNFKIAEVTATTYQDAGLAPNTFYSYAVSAFDDTGNESFQSSLTSITTPLTTASATSTSTSTPASTEPTLQDLQKQIQELVKLVVQLQLKVLEFLKARGR